MHGGEQALDHEGLEDILSESGYEKAGVGVNLGKMGSGRSDGGIVLAQRGGMEENIMEFNIFYKKKNGWYIGHIQEYPDYESQGRTLDELKRNLIEIYCDINEGLVPDAEPFQLMKVAV